MSATVLGTTFRLVICDKSKTMIDLVWVFTHYYKLRSYLNRTTARAKVFWRLSSEKGIYEISWQFWEAFNGADFRCPYYWQEFSNSALFCHALLHKYKLLHRPVTQLGADCLLIRSLAILQFEKCGSIKITSLLIQLIPRDCSTIPFYIVST